MGFKGGGGGGGRLLATDVEPVDETLAVAVYGGGGAACEFSDGGGGGAFLYVEALLDGASAGPKLVEGLLVAVVLDRPREPPPFCVRATWTIRAKKLNP